MRLKAITKTAKRCCECYKIISHWNQSGFCSACYRAFKNDEKKYNLKETKPLKRCIYCKGIMKSYSINLYCSKHPCYARGLDEFKKTEGGKN